MTNENRDILLQLLDRHRELGISSQIDYDKFYLYSIIVHSTAIEGSTVTEVEAQLLFDEGITSSKRTMLEQLMNLDLKDAYDYGREWVKPWSKWAGERAWERDRGLKKKKVENCYPKFQLHGH